MTSKDEIYSQLAQIALSEFVDIVEDTRIIEGKLRVFLKDESFILIFGSQLRKRGFMPIIGKGDMLTERYTDIITSRIKKLKNFKPIQSIFIMEPRRMR